MSQQQDQPTAEPRPTKRVVAADLIEQTPASGGLAYWVLASPLLLFLGWLWIDTFIALTPTSWVFPEVVLGILIYIFAITLPLGYGAHKVVTSFPQIFQHAGWDVQPLEKVEMAELPMIRYSYRTRRRAKRSWSRAWSRAAQGWVYLEIAAIFIGAIVMIPLFFSAVEFGFGS